MLHRKAPSLQGCLRDRLFIVRELRPGQCGELSQRICLASAAALPRQPVVQLLAKALPERSLAVGVTSNRAREFA